MNTTHGNNSQGVFFAPKPTFEQLCAMDPRILTLYQVILSIMDDERTPSFCANRLWYGVGEINDQPFSLKDDLSELVGVPLPGELRTHPFLATSAAYDIVYRKLYSALPPCRNCLCAVVEMPESEDEA